MSEPPARQRLAAILAADAVGFSRLMSADERATVAALDVARAVFKASIEARQGRVIDMAGDSVLAVFETAAGAVEAALEIQQGLATRSASSGPERRMLFRIGVHLGDVIEKADGTVYGDGVNVAARLQALAEAGGIAVSDTVRGVVSSRILARFADRGEQALKNIARPVRVFTVVAGSSAAREDSPAHSPLAAPAPRFVPSRLRRPGARPAALFVGRQQEMAQLTNALESAKKGRGQVLLLAASGGMGKTRLAQELAARAETDGVQAYWGRCLEEPGAPAFWPWRQLIRACLRSYEEGDLAPVFGSVLADIAAIVPDLPDRTGALRAESEIGDNALSRFRLFDAVVDFWRLAARRAPVLLIFEDLHWADATSLRLLAYLAAELEESGLLVLGTYRDTELSRQHPLLDTLAELARCSTFSRLELRGLSSRETGELMTAASGGAAGAGLVSAMHARTEGHPLFLEEMLRYLMDASAAHPEGMIGDEAELLMKIPSGVRDVIGKRLNRLSAPAGRLLSIAACIGRSFDLDLLVRLEAEKSEDEVLQALEEALAVHLIEPVAHTQQFRFGHALIRETLYDDMLALRRARLHLRIGEMLEQRPGDDPALSLPQLAYHFSEAGPGAAADKALRYAVQSAEQAVRLFAFEEAVRLHGLALRVQQQHFARDGAQRCLLLIGLGHVQLSLGAGEPAQAAFQEAAGLAREHSLAVSFVQAAIGVERGIVIAARWAEPAVNLLLEAIALHPAEDALRVELLARQCRAHVYCDRADAAKEAYARAVALARRVDDPQRLFLALAAITSTVFWPDLLSARVAAAAECLALARDLDLPLDGDAIPHFMNNLIQSGDSHALRRLLDEGLRRAEQTHSPYLQTLCRHCEALIAINEGRFADAESWAAQALHSGRRLAEAQAVSSYGMQMFCLRREQGRLREALPMLQHFVRTTPKALAWKPGLALLYAELDMREECQAQFDELPWDRLSIPMRDVSSTTVVMFAGEVCTYLEDAARAALLYPVLAPHTGTNLMADFGGPCLGSADRLLGDLASVLAHWDVAERHFEAALAMDRASGARVWLAHSRHAYARMLHRRDLPGDGERARALLADARSDSIVLAMTALTPRIESLVERIANPLPQFPCGLTEREVGVLRLVALGRNNREIGQVLEIRPFTVANHVRRILEKTYTANRTEAAAFANREGLLGP